MRKNFLLFLILSSPLLATPWKPLPWNKAASSSSQQQQKYFREQQHWNQQSDPRVMERKMRQEHQKWERDQKKRKKAALSKMGSNQK